MQTFRLLAAKASSCRIRSCARAWCAPDAQQAVLTCSALTWRSFSWLVAARRAGPRKLECTFLGLFAVCFSTLIFSFFFPSFLQMNERRPDWRCPVCNHVVRVPDLRYDEFTLDILRATDADTDQVSGQLSIVSCAVHPAPSCDSFLFARSCTLVVPCVPFVSLSYPLAC